LNASATTLVNAVGTLGVYAPAKTLQELESLRQIVTSAQADTARALQEVTIEIGSAKRDLSSELDGVKTATSGIVPALSVLDSKVDNIQYEVGGAAQGLTGLKEAAERTEQSLYTLHERVVSGAGRHPVEIHRPRPDAASGVDGTVEAGSGRLAEHVAALTTIEETMTQRADALVVKLDELSAQHQALGKLNSRLAAILSWQERAARAPLMKFLTLPFARARQVERPDGA
jgi:chromosome segregation ATPase